LTCGKWQGPPRNPCGLIIQLLVSFGISRFKLAPSSSPEYQLTRRKWTFVIKIHENHQNVTFWNQFCRYVFSKSNEKVTKILQFLIFLCFFMKMWPVSIEKTFSQTLRNRQNAFISGGSNDPISIIYCVLETSLYWEIDFCKKLCF
jgi:hypothetical protein